MTKRDVPAADLLTAAALALGGANQTAACAGAPAMLREMELTLDLTGGLCVTPCGLVFRNLQSPSLQENALIGRGAANIHLRVTVIAAPALTPVPQERGNPCGQQNPGTG